VPTTVRSSADLAALERGLNALAAVVARQQDQVAALQAERDDRLRRRLPRADVLLLTRLLPPLSGAWGSDTFFAADVFAEPALAPIVVGRSVKALGKLFARAAGVPIGRYVLVAVGRENGAWRWQVRGVE
jgi:hypothetical protein